MAFPIAAAFTGITSIISTIFGFKGQQAETLSKALDVVSTATSSNAQREQAIAQIIAAEASSDAWLTRMWRPLTMVCFVGILLASWFGYTPSGINAPLSPTMDRIFNIIEIGLMGYIPARTIDKIVTQMNLSKILKTFIEKKL